MFGFLRVRNGRLFPAPLATQPEAPVRTFIALSLLVLFSALASIPLVAQTTPPVFVFLLESTGAPAAVHVFAMNPSGVLTEAPGSPFNAGLTPYQLVVDPTGRFLYVVNGGSQDITEFSINPSTGTLAELPGSPVAFGANPVTMGIDPTGRFLYAFANTSVNGVENEFLYEYTIDSVAGVLTPAGSSPTQVGSGSGAQITSIAFNPAGNFAYLGQAIGGGTQAPTLICSVDFSTGNLSPVSAVQPASGGANQMAVSLNGGSLFSVDTTDGALDAFSMAPGAGQLMEFAGMPSPVGPSPDSVAVSPSGNFVYVANENVQYQAGNPPSQYDGSVSGFAVNEETMTLTQVPGSPFADGINPGSIVVDPSGSFVYTSSTTYTSGYTGFAQVLAFSINASSGTLTPLPAPAWTDTSVSIGAELVIAYGSSGMTNPTPMISSLSPASTTATDSAFTLQVNGSNFVPASTVYFGGQPQPTTFVSSSQLNASIPGSEIADGGTGIVFVFSPLPGGGASTSVEFPVFNPAPGISALGPASIAAGSGPFTLNVSGSGFVTSSVVSFNGVAMPTSFGSPTVVAAQIPGSQDVSQGTATVSVSSPSNGLPGGGTSNTVTFTITPPIAAFEIIGLSPATATTGGPAFTLAVNGSGFAPGAQITFNLNNVATTYVSSTELTAVIPASAIATAGNPYVIVINPSGINSNEVNFVVDNPQPAGGSVSPPSLPAGSNALSLTVNGAGFVQGSVVFVNGTSRVTLFVSSTSLQATLLPADLAQAGTLVITVMNPAPGGGTSTAINVPVTDYSMTVSNSSPPVTAGETANFTLMVSPSGGAFSNPVTFGVSSQLPTGAAASFAPSATLTPGASAKTLSLAITTTPRTINSGIALRHPQNPNVPEFGVLFGAAALVSMWLFAVAVRTRRLAAPILLVLLLATGMIACGAVGTPTSTTPTTATSPNPEGTPAGTYPITVTATSGGDTHATTVTLTVM